MPAAIVGGAGAFGVSAALELQSRGWDVSLVDPNLALHEHQRLSSSDDVSKILRGDYGHDEMYFDLFQVALERWRAMLSPAVHWTGVGFVTQQARDEDSFERASLAMHLAKKEACLVMSSREQVSTRLPGLKRHVFEWGYINLEAGGWAESSKVITAWHDEARRRGVCLVPQTVKAIHRDSASCELSNGDIINANVLVVCAGAWTRFLVPEVKDLVFANAMPVFHFRAPAQAPDCPVCLDIGKTGFYTFPAQSGFVKVGHHGKGYRLHAPATRETLDQLALATRSEELAKFAAFFQTVWPELVQEEEVRFLMCQYCDSHNGDFLVDQVPGTRGKVVVACGGSGHGFKFAPVMGEIIADCVEAKRPSRDARIQAARKRFAWRNPDSKGKEEARL
jgi:sarcosine oxidase/L-pipecolate oxidase